MNVRIRLCFGVLFALAACSKTLAAPYSVTILTPSFATLGSAALGVNGGIEVGYGRGPSTGSANHALMWNGNASSYVDLNPAGFANSVAEAASGNLQVGYGDSASNGLRYALLWSGNAASCVTLNPPNILGGDIFDGSVAEAVSGGIEVGLGYDATPGSIEHALLWTGSSSSCVDLNPAGFAESSAFGVSGGTEVGFVYGPTTGSQVHAVLWKGSAASYVDLNPPGVLQSTAYGVYGGTEVGYGSIPGVGQHALLWHGNAANYVDLNPPGFVGSEAYGIYGTTIVGSGIGPSTPGTGQNHALVWFGTADSAVDLNPPGFTSSIAHTIDSSGDIVGYGTDSLGNQQALLWTPTPEPSTLVLAGFGAAALYAAAHSRSRRNCRAQTCGEYDRFARA